MQTYTIDNSHPDVTQTNKPVVLWVFTGIRAEKEMLNQQANGSQWSDDVVLCDDVSSQVLYTTANETSVYSGVGS